MAAADSVSGAGPGKLGTDQCLEGFAGHDEVLDDGMLYKHSVRHWLQTGIAQLNIDSSQLVLWKMMKTQHPKGFWLRCTERDQHLVS